MLSKKKKGLDLSTSQLNHSDISDSRGSYVSKMRLRSKKKKLMYSAFSFSGVKEMVIDFVCREDLNITTLKEFFEVFIASIKK